MVMIDATTIPSPDPKLKTGGQPNPFNVSDRCMVPSAPITALAFHTVRELGAVMQNIS